MSDIAIRVDRLSKRYRIGAAVEPYHTLRDTIARLVRAPFTRRRDPAATDLWALDDVSFEIRQGEVVGIIGGNGAGKSTLLKILSRITTPTRGRAQIAGRVASLLEVGTGFHPELTGRENIFLNGAILGMTRREIAGKFDAIVAFAEVDRFIDTAVKYYSSGMYVRLAFAVAAHLEPEILIVDEVLSVGDARFQQKCLGKMDDVAKGGKASGHVRSMVAQYLGGDARASFAADRRSGHPQILEAEVIDAQGACVAKPLNTDAFGFRVRFALPEARSGVTIGIGVLAADGTVVFTNNSDDVALAIPREAGDYEASIMLPADTLMAGDYHLAVCLWDVGQIFDLQEPALSFSLEYGPSVLYDSGDRKGLVHVRCAWRLGAAEPAAVTS